MGSYLRRARSSPRSPWRALLQAIFSLDFPLIASTGNSQPRQESRILPVSLYRIGHSVDGAADEVQKCNSWKLNRFFPAIAASAIAIERPPWSVLHALDRRNLGGVMSASVTYIASGYFFRAPISARSARSSLRAALSAERSIFL